jgi:hypothetical protein
VMDGFVFYMDLPTDEFKKATELYVGKRFVSKLQVRPLPPFLRHRCVLALQTTSLISLPAAPPLKRT